MTTGARDFDPTIVYLVLGHDGYRLLANSLLTMREVGINSDVIIAGSAKELREFHSPVDNVRLMEIADGANDFFDYGSAGFSQVMKSKLELIIRLLRDGRDILYVDIDVAWIGNPIDYIIDTMSAYDLVFQREPKAVFPSEPCFGFFAARPSNKALSFFEKQRALFVERRRSDAALPIQFTTVELFRSHPELLREIFFLSDYQFPTGPLHSLLRNGSPLPGLIDAGRPYIFHANWIVGAKAKERFLRRLGLWRLENRSRDPRRLMDRGLTRHLPKTALRLVGSRLMTPIRRLRSRESRRISPRTIKLEASSFCQLRCPSCPTTAQAIHPAVGSGFLRFDAFKELIDLNPGLQSIEISNYGEVFLNPDLVQILRYAHDKGVSITIGNGANLNNVRDDALEALVRYKVGIVGCSIDGASPETYRVYRVRGDFDTVIANVQKINAFKKKYNSDLPRLVWQFVVFGHNEHEIPLARATAADLGMEFRTKLTWDSNFSPIRDKDFVRAQTGEQAVSREEYEQLWGRKYLSQICLQLWDDPQINWDGKVLGCSRNFWGDFGGNAFIDGLEESLNNSKISYARDMLMGLLPARDDIPCTTCELYEHMLRRGEFLAVRS